MNLTNKIMGITFFLHLTIVYEGSFWKLFLWPAANFPQSFSSDTKLNSAILVTDNLVLHFSRDIPLFVAPNCEL